MLQLTVWDPPSPPHSLIFKKFEKSTAVPDMAPEPKQSELLSDAKLGYDNVGSMLLGSEGEYWYRYSLVALFTPRSCSTRGYDVTVTRRVQLY